VNEHESASAHLYPLTRANAFERSTTLASGTRSMRACSGACFHRRACEPVAASATTRSRSTLRVEREGRRERPVGLHVFLELGHLLLGGPPRRRRRR
jgi:hypothetical protein